MIKETVKLQKTTEEEAAVSWEVQATPLWEHWSSSFLTGCGNSCCKAEGRQHEARGNSLALSLDQYH